MKALDILKKANKGGYGIMALNFANLETLKAIMAAAEKLNSPVMACASTGAIKFIGTEYLRGMITAVKKTAKVPVIFHLDHGDTLDSVKLCIDLGFDSVMIDASGLPYDENVSLTKAVVDYAHSKNIPVEAELGTLAGVEDEISHKTGKYTDPDQAADFIKKTGADTLAIAIGTSHGAYKFSGDAHLKFDILEKIQKKIPNTPLVLHGASSVPPALIEKFKSVGGVIDGMKGVPEDILVKATKNYNICKINSDTDLRIAYTAAVIDYIKKNPADIDPRNFLKPALADVTALCIQKIRTITGENRA